MRWLTLYARSRHVPATLAVVLTGTVLAWAATRGGTGDPRLPALALAAGAMAASIGLGGQDPALDRTAAIRWTTRRAAHVLLAAALLAAALLGTGTSAALVARDSAGLMGLAALGAALHGAHHAWTLPFAWLALAFVAPPPTSTAARIVSWPLLPPDSTAAAWTALTLTATGVTAYALAGPRR
ncbi:hypothetical protein PV682_31150 [Streptomyces niveiscabiei]|uniref:hypothetical protein n=1 Tax=Streptomyces niveiscabiei TaxID=164115 RepID=UPI0029A73F0B|nr:hypothetical protein [Streptomyces niveiscabiei]MDX3385883.1 hypothetical protein [Streptomyces niveiscabiei]